MNQRADENESRCVSLKGAATILGVCVRTVLREIQRGKLKAFRAGRQWRVRLADLRDYMQGVGSPCNV
jgi:excisionase family DNA binding protein